MGINIRTKGQEGEREVARAMNSIVNTALTAANLPLPTKDIIQRNQNQSAVGGGDLSGAWGLSVEVKRQEQLSVNTWWAQCVASAKQEGGVPCLVYRKNKQKWSVVMNGHLLLPNGHRSTIIRMELDWDSFLKWFYLWVVAKIQIGDIPAYV